MSDKDLIIELSQGNELAFNHLVDTYKERLFYFAQHYLDDFEQSKDVIQDVFSDLWLEHTKIRDVKNLSSWLYTMTKFQCLKRIEHLKVKRKYEDELKHQQIVLAHDALKQLDTSALVFDEINTILQQTLSQLPSQTREIFEMSRFENKKNREIAELLGISVKTVEAAITKSLKELRPALQNYLPLFLL